MMPYFKHLPDTYLPWGKTHVEKAGAAIGGISALGIATHAIGSVVTGRMGKNLIKGTQLHEPGPGEKVSANEIILQSLTKKITESNNEISQELVMDKLEELQETQKGIRRDLDKI